MRRPSYHATALGLLAALLALGRSVHVTAAASTKPAGTTAAPAPPPPGLAASAGPGGDTPTSRRGPALPAGHPPLGAGDRTGDDVPNDDEDGDAEERTGPDAAPGGPLPPGHPPVNGRGSQQPGPVAQAEDSVQTDGALPSGTVVVDIVDGSEHPLAKIPVVLKLLVQTIAKTDTRNEITAATDEAGSARFTRLLTGATASYRAQVTWPTHSRDAATYLSPPFQLDLTRGQRVRMHVYPATSDLSQAMVGMQGMIFVQLVDEVLQFHQLFQIYNLGRTTWIPSDVVIDLPRAAKAFQTESGMGSVWFEQDGSSVRLRGTVAPGQHEVEMAYQVPYDASGAFAGTVAMPPHVARMQVMAEGSKDTSLTVQGFPAARVERNRRGQRVLVAERNARPGERPMNRIEIRLENLPTPSSAPEWAAALAALGLLVGLYLGFSGREGGRENMLSGMVGNEARRRIVAELAVLEQAHQSGAVGPNTYARARRELVDALARLLPAAAHVNNNP